LSAKVRAEFTMYNGLAVALVPVAAIAIVDHAWVLAAGSFMLAPVMAFRGLTTEKTFKKTTRSLHAALQDAPREGSPNNRRVLKSSHERPSGGSVRRSTK